MRSIPSFALAAFAAIVTGVGLGAGLGTAGCSSSTSGTAPFDAGGSGTAPPDGGPPVGAVCASDSDCPGGQCSNTVFSAGNPIYPTPVCLASCPAASSIVGCGGQTLPGAGLCQPPAASGSPGLCLPYCEVTPSGAAVGCAANDACQLLGSNGPNGAGWCQPGCTTNSQCPAGSVCDPLLAACDANPLRPTLPIGAVCSLTANPPPCNCVGTATGTQGYCTAACVTGGTVCPTPPADGGAGAAPDGGEAGAPAGSAPWVCSAGLNFVAGADGGAIFAAQPPGLFGFCAPACNADADCASIQGRCAKPDPAAPAGFTGTCVTGG